MKSAYFDLVTLTGAWFACRFFHSLFLIFSLSHSVPLPLSLSPPPHFLSLFCALLISKQVRAGEQFPLWLTSIQPCRLVSRGRCERGAAVVPSPGDQISPEMPGECHLELPDRAHVYRLEDLFLWVLYILAERKCTGSISAESARQDSPSSTKTVRPSDKSHRCCSQKEPGVNLGVVTYSLC